MLGMRKGTSRALLLSACLLLLAATAFAMGGYKDLLWIDAKGHAIHVIADGTTTLTSFLRYREVRLENSNRKPGHFVCTQDGIEKQIPVREIRSIKLALSAEQFSGSPRSDRLSRLILTMKDGESFEVLVKDNMAFGLCNDESIEFKYWDPVTEQFLFGGFNGSSLREIRFN